MKQKFSTSWVASKQPRKQRKYLINAPKHVKRKFMSATLSKDLRAKHNRRSIEVRMGDEVEVMRGKFDGKKGKITAFNTRKSKVAVEGLQMTKKEGTKVNVWFSPSKVKIITLDENDKTRFQNKNKMGEVKNAPVKK